jgi:branched-chain amino acid transport system ATP-binding protein
LVVKRLTQVVAALVAKGIGVLLVEQFVWVALSRASEVMVPRKGVVRLSSDPARLRADPTLLTTAYLLSVVIL